MESLQNLLIRTIKEGVPLFNAGNHKECFEIYLRAAKYACQQSQIVRTPQGQILEQAAEEAEEVLQQDSSSYGEAAWVLRHAFDEILSQDREKHSEPVNAEETATESEISTGTLTKEDNRRSSLYQIQQTGLTEDESVGYQWQDERGGESTDFDKAQSLADIYTILVSSITPTTHTRFTTTYEKCVSGAAIVETLINLGLAVHRKHATEKGNYLFMVTLIRPVTHPSEPRFRDGTRLYRFATTEEITEHLELLTSGEQSSEDSSQELQLMILRAVLEVPLLPGNDNAVRSAARSSLAWHIDDDGKGLDLATLAAKVESLVEIEDRKYNFRTYSQCFVGSKSITALVNNKFASDRQEAQDLLNQLLHAGLIHHVARDHEIEDKHLFYRFTAAKDLQKVLDTYNLVDQPTAGSELVKYRAIIHRLKQYAGLNVSEILNSFYGADADSQGIDCWDVVDLQIWRNNMKRWGFGRPEDQDNDMVNKLSFIVQNIDTETWNMEDQDEEWSTPWGILAQIAIFDQVPRSAFRGTADAFKWDHIAIKATKFAIEKGYFHTAYKSTLNLFVILLPLEHSESWEDQKLGVTLLLQLLSTVAVQDEGLSDYEIVKRLEFSKRLTTAFLEHAQVIAKFHRYPHRNPAHGRTTTLEERIWLASDLVPRWAKSQKPGSPSGGTGQQRNRLQLPVIPLKRLAKG